MNDNKNQGPWPIIGHFIIGMAIGTMLRRHWRLIVGSIVAFLAISTWSLPITLL